MSKCDRPSVVAPIIPIRDVRKDYNQIKGTEKMYDNFQEGYVDHMEDFRPQWAKKFHVCWDHIGKIRNVCDIPDNADVTFVTSPVSTHKDLVSGDIPEDDLISAIKVEGENYLVEVFLSGNKVGEYVY